MPHTLNLRKMYSCRMDRMTDVSIIIRSFNDISFIERTMSAVKSQRYRDYEIINVDSGSTDGTYELICGLNASGVVYQIPKGTYVPGRVLNEAVSKCSGKYIIFNNSDCIPQNDRWLEELIKPLTEDPECAAVFGNQLPRPDARPLVRKDSIRAFGDGKISSGWFHFFSLATSAVRKKDIEEQPFDPDITFSEDVEWSYRMKQSGKKIVYAKDAVVEHSHNYSLSEVKRRFHGEGVAEAKIFGFKPSVMKQFIKPLISESLRDVIYLVRQKEISHIPYGIAYRLIQKLSVYKGIKDFVEKGAQR